jgi:hypothetical protein
MKKIILIAIMVIATSFVTACNTVTSQVSYPVPIVASETRVFVGRKMTYAEARNEAISNANAAGYTKILSETTENNNWMGEVVVSLTMTQ